jgi:SHS2 domain-containing protein
MYRWLEHTTERELWIEDEATKAVLGEAAIALGDLLREHPGGEPLMHEVSLGASDLPTLLMEWLRELVRLASEDGFVPERILKMDLSGNAAASGRRRGV